MWSQCDHTIALVSSIHYRRVIAIKSSIHLIMGFWTFGVCFGEIPQCQVFTGWMLSNQTGFESIHLIMRSWTLGFCIGEPQLGVSKTEWKTSWGFKNWTEPRFGVLKTKQKTDWGFKNRTEPRFGVLQTKQKSDRGCKNQTKPHSVFQNTELGFCSVF